MKSYMGLESVSKDLNTVISDVILSKINGPELLFEIDSLCKGLDNLIIKVLIAPKVQ